MTNLRCSVKECIHHNDDYCCRPEIMVSGKSACGSEQTNCSSFAANDENTGAQNSCGCSAPNEQLSIRCEAEKCIYNQQGACSADGVRVTSCTDQGATCESETQCQTFKMH